MKNIIIGGVPRSGKTTLAKRLKEKFGYSIVSGDALVSSFGKVFPEHGITHFHENHAAACIAFRPFIFELLHHLEYEGVPFALDLYHVLPQDVSDLVDSYGIVFLGFPFADVAEKCSNIRNKAKPQDWTEDLSQAQLQQIVRRFVTESKELSKSCIDFGIPFIDSSTDFDRAMKLAFDTISLAAQ